VNQNNPQNLTVRGRLSWPVWTVAEALKRNPKSKFPKPDDQVKASFNLLLGEAQTEKVLTHLKDVFFPWCIEQEKAGQKSGLTAAQVKKLNRNIDDADWATDGVFGLIGAVPEKSAELAPEAVINLKVNGLKGRDLEQKAVVKSEDQLKNPTGDLVIPERGLILPVSDTNLELYPGSIVAATINLFAFVGAQPGVTASAGAVIFVQDAERFGGGGTEIDEDSIFMDDDE
jgi:hypothetical protein